MIYLISLIVILTIILYLIYKDFLQVLKITSIVTISSGILTFVVGYLIKYLINKNLSFIRISNMTKIIVSKFVLNGIQLLILGLIESTVFFIIKYGFKRKNIDLKSQKNI